MPSIAERFWTKVNKSGPVPQHRPDLGPCWVWTSNKLPTGYGLFKIGQTNKVASRIARELEAGPLPDSVKVLHHCDNPSCVRPSHTYLGTQKENAHDRDSRGRNGLAKLTAAVVREVRAQAEQGVPQKDLCKQFGVHAPCISAIVNRKTWRHI